MSNKKKPIHVGVIRGEDIRKKSRPRLDVPFQTGEYLREEDRPRKKIRPIDLDDEDLGLDLDDDLEF